MKFRDFQRLTPPVRKVYWESYKKRLTGATVNRKTARPAPSKSLYLATTIIPKSKENANGGIFIWTSSIDLRRYTCNLWRKSSGCWIRPPRKAEIDIGIY